MGGEIADLDLASVSWASDDEGRCARLALLLDTRWHGARQLCLSLPQADEDSGDDEDEALKQRLYLAWGIAAGGAAWLAALQPASDDAQAALKLLQAQKQDPRLH